MQTQFELKKIGIRPFVIDDVKAYHAAALESVPEAFQFMPWCHPEYSLAEAQGWIELQIQLRQQKHTYGFIIYEIETQELCGAVEVANINATDKSADFGYWMRSSKTGKNYTSTAAYLAANFAFEELKLDYLKIYCLPENIASRRIAEKLGAQFVEELPAHSYMHGEMRDAVFYKLSANDFMANKEKLSPEKKIRAA